MEAILLTGGASRRMGEDKARLALDGEVVSERIARDLRGVCDKVTVLGKEPIGSCEFLPDAEEYAGPLVALSRFKPVADYVFVVSCDLPRFDARLVELCLSRIENRDAVLPVNEDKVQPLCALYDSHAWTALRKTVAAGRKSMMAWVDLLNCHRIPPLDLTEAGIDERAICGANTPEEWKRLTKREEIR